jgi:alpha-tubulin suppressor-like RCC1 family protein
MMEHTSESTRHVATRVASILGVILTTGLGACGSSSPATGARDGAAGGGGGGGTVGMPALDAGTAGAMTSGLGEDAGGAGGTNAPSIDAFLSDASDSEASAIDASAPEPRRAISVVVGTNHSCALLEDHSVKCWGDNGSGQLGYGDTESRGLSPAQMGDVLPTVDLGTGRTAVAIGASQAHTCALLDDGSVKCWGNGPSLGLPGAADRGTGPGQMGDALPTIDLGKGRTAEQIAVGYEDSCALLDDGTVKCWGLLDPSDPTSSHLTPTRFAIGTTMRIRSLVAGGRGVYLMLDDQTMLGDIPVVSPLVPWPMPGARVKAFGGANKVLCGIFVGGGVLCEMSTPPATLSDLVAIGAAEAEGSCGLSADGAARCWNMSVGIPNPFWTDGTMLDGGIKVVGPPPLKSIASGGLTHMCALAADGRVWCWGTRGAPIGASVDDANVWRAVNLGTRQ